MLKKGSHVAPANGIINFAEICYHDPSPFVRVLSVPVHKVEER